MEMRVSCDLAMTTAAVVSQDTRYSFGGDGVGMYIFTTKASFTNPCSFHSSQVGNPHHNSYHNVGETHKWTLRTPYEDWDYVVTNQDMAQASELPGAWGQAWGRSFPSTFKRSVALPVFLAFPSNVRATPHFWRDGGDARYCLS